jgi:hypothetical protein
VRRPGSGPGSATAACQAADDDGEERDNSVDDGLETGGNGVNDGHDAVADGAEDRLDLLILLEASHFKEKGNSGERTHDTTAPMFTVLCGCLD